MFGQQIFAIRGNKSCTNDREGKAPENINIFRPHMYLISIFYDCLTGSYSKDRQAHYIARNYNILE
jgi:hypothetical protein